MLVRKLVFAMGYRYRLHGKQLPGSPDLVFASRQKVIFVHGCFWHRHQGCPSCRTPKTRIAFWENKFDQNVTRDKRALAALESLGWRYLIVWECALRDVESLQTKLEEFLNA